MSLMDYLVQAHLTYRMNELVEQGLHRAAHLCQDPELCLIEMLRC
jgi:hypothetical protein